MGAGADGEIEVGLGDLELLKEDVRHEGVVVLPGVDQRLPQAVLAEGGEDGSGFHEIGAGTDDVKYVHEKRPISSRDNAAG